MRTNKLETVCDVVRAAGEILLESFSRSQNISYKGVINIVTDIDRECERFIYEKLHNIFPDYGFIGEEGIKQRKLEGATWIVDPLDGTTNFVRGYPLFATSIALEIKGEIVFGAVYNPLSKELFTAERGKGAKLNGLPIYVSQTNELNKAVLASGFPYDAWSNPINNCKEWCRIIQKTISVRCDGCASLDLCHVAMGRLDGYWELDLEAWDMAAGGLIVQEAGGIVSLINGESFSPYQRNVMASNGYLHSVILEVLKDG